MLTTSMFVRLSALAAALAVLPTIVLARQIPVVDGVIGGTRASVPETFKAADLKAAATTPGKLRVTENSGVCETTPGVYQASGYGDLTANESIWCVLPLLKHPSVLSFISISRFWFFESRNSPDTAPLSIWLNGGVSSRSFPYAIHLSLKDATPAW